MRISLNSSPLLVLMLHPDLRRTRSWTTRSKQSLLDIHVTADKSNLLDQIFLFIGSKPEKAVSVIL